MQRIFLHKLNSLIQIAQMDRDHVKKYHSKNVCKHD